MGQLFRHRSDALANDTPSLHGRAAWLHRSARNWQLRLLPMHDVTVLLLIGGGHALQSLDAQDSVSLHLPLSAMRADVSSDGRHHAPRARADMRMWLGGQAPVPARPDWLNLHFCHGAIQREDIGEHNAGGLPATRMLRSHSAALLDLAAWVRRLYAVPVAQSHALCTQARTVAAQQLLQLVVQVFNGQAEDGAVLRGRRPLERGQIAQRCLDVIESRLGQNVSVDDLCTAAGVSDRTLRTIFLELFGLSPHRYVMIRRLHAVHDALRNARAGDTVASLCSDFGVWDFGRFARQYRQTFGVLPSQDLRRCQPQPSMAASLRATGRARAGAQHVGVP